MTVVRKKNGRASLMHAAYVPRDIPHHIARDSFDGSGIPLLWVGDRHLLVHADVRELVDALNRWLATGSLAEREAKK